MSDRKTEFKYFTIFDYEKEQDYLRERHLEGWKLTRVTFPGFYHFIKCEPEDVVYQLDYNKEGIAHKDEYVRMFQDCGWEYLMDFVGYSYFRKPASEMREDEGIFCDDSSRLEMVRRVFRGRMVPLLIIFFLVIIPELIVQAYGRTVWNQCLFAAYLICLIVYLIVFVRFGFMYLSYKKKVR